MTFQAITTNTSAIKIWAFLEYYKIQFFAKITQHNPWSKIFIIQYKFFL